MLRQGQEPSEHGVPEVETPAPETLVAPSLSPGEIRELLAERFGITGETRELGGQQDANHLVDGRGGRHVLKLSPVTVDPDQFAVQHRAMRLVAAAVPGLGVPVPVAGIDGHEVQTVTSLGGGCHARLLAHVDGSPVMDSRYLAPAAIGRLGEIAGQVCRALEELEGAPEQSLQWDVRMAPSVVEPRIAHVPAEHWADLSAAMDQAWRAVAGLELPVQAIHGDITDNNVVGVVGRNGRWMPGGVIDFGDVMSSWAVGELAATVASVLHHRSAGPAGIIPAVRAFDRVRRLSDDEIAALWHLVVLRAGILVVSGREQAVLDPGNDYVRAALDREWLIYTQATSVPAAVMTAQLRAALGRERSTAPITGVRIVDVPLQVVDLSVTSPFLDEGRWLEEGIEEQLLAAAAAQGGAVARHGEYRLTRARPHQESGVATLALGAQILLREAEEVRAPWSGEIDAPDGLLRLSATGRPALTISGLKGAVEGTVEAGAVLGTLPGGVSATVQLSHVAGAPAFVTPDLADGWLAACPDPAPLLGIEPLPDMGAPAELLARRDRSFALVQEHYFEEPPQIERGWRDLLVDTRAQTYVDVLNNVTLVGHGHPRLAKAVADQWRRLNTNSRFHYASVVEYAERLAGLLPDRLDTVFLVNSGSEADDLALRLAWAHTGRQDVVAVAEAYHGWTFLTDAISTSIADNPAALETRPDWVHVLEAPNTYRGRYRGDEAIRYVPEAVDAVQALVDSGRPPAALLCEPYYGNAGGMPLPDGYLAALYDEVRAAGGVCIADEIQVGFGRLGRWFWGFEQQQVVPDIVAVAKGIGNGHPLGAVITTAEIAASYRKEGYFFSSTGGSPVSAVVGNTVLDIMADERLAENVRVVGDHLRGRLEELATRHPLIGAVHGSGMYLGVEFVRNRETREPATEETDAICERLRELGVIVQPTSDRLCVLKIKPPLCMTRESADHFADMLEEVFAGGW